MKRQENMGWLRVQGWDRHTGASFPLQAAFIGNSSIKQTHQTGNSMMGAAKKESCPSTPAELSASTRCFGKRGHGAAISYIPICFQEQGEAMVPVSLLGVLAISLHSSRRYFLMYLKDKHLKKGGR